MFIPRMSAPDSSDKRWIQSRAGGLNPCIAIYGGPSVLPNCFTGDTRIITQDCAVRLDSIVDQEIEALSQGGEYRRAVGHCYGEQPIYKITFDNGQEFKCTANHRWVIYEVTGMRFVTTLELTECDLIPYVSGKDSRGHYFTRMVKIEDLCYSDTVYCIEEPETHTMVLEGGILTGQCVGYAWGRFLEVMGGTTCNLSTANAGDWWGYTQDGYERGNTPRLGSVICWRRPGEAGHVAIVEQINADGSIVTSNSAYNSTRFYTQTLYPPAYTWSNLYILQGFIYNPNVAGGLGNKIEGFITAAKDLVGKEMKRGLGSTFGPSIQFLLQCTRAVPGIANVVIPLVGAPSDLPKKGVSNSMGEFIEGPLYGNERSPEVGDIALLRNSETKKYATRVDCDKLAIITEVKGSDISAVHVNSLNVVANTTYKTSYRAICGYFRPDWSKVNNVAYAAGSYAQVGKLYDTENTAEDATIREVGYMSDRYEPTLSDKSKMKLSVVNYTTVLSALFQGLVGPSTTGVNVITDQLGQKEKIVADFMLDKGLNAAAACGMLGNIYYESNFNTAAVGDYGTSFGICQWHFGRGDNMKRVAGDTWYNNLTGQLEYLWQELQGGYSSTVLAHLNAVSNTVAGAQLAADTFVRNFEIPANVDDESKRRQAKAAEYFNLLVIQETTSTSGSSFVQSNQVMSGHAVEIPQWIAQDGISAIYTNYTYFYTVWGRSTYQRKVADIWNSKGRKSNRGIATIDGFYLVALKPIFGLSGDKVSIVLQDNTVINCIIADTKGNDSGANIYGHDAGGGRINIVEWETVGSASSVYTNSPDLSGWAGKSVTKIIKGDSIL